MNDFNKRSRVMRRSRERIKKWFWSELTYFVNDVT